MVYIKKMNYQQCSMCSFSRAVFNIRFNYSLSGKPQFLEMPQVMLNSACAI